MTELQDTIITFQKEIETDADLQKSVFNFYVTLLPMFIEESDIERIRASEDAISTIQLHEQFQQKITAILNLGLMKCARVIKDLTDGKWDEFETLITQLKVVLVHMHNYLEPTDTIEHADKAKIPPLLNKIGELLSKKHVEDLQETESWQTIADLFSIDDIKTDRAAKIGTVVAQIQKTLEKEKKCDDAVIQLDRSDSLNRELSHESDELKRDLQAAQEQLTKQQQEHNALTKQLQDFEKRLDQCSAANQDCAMKKDAAAKRARFEYQQKVEALKTEYEQQSADWAQKGLLNDEQISRYNACRFERIKQALALRDAKDIAIIDAAIEASRTITLKTADDIINRIKLIVTHDGPK